MASNAFNSFNTMLQMDDGAGNYTTISEVKDINDFGYVRAVHDITNQSSTGGYEEILPSGIRRSREMTIPVNTLPADATHNFSTGYLGAWTNTLKRNWKIIMPGSRGTWAFAAYVLEFAQNFPVDGPAVGTFRLKPTGAPTLSVP